MDLDPSQDETLKQKAQNLQAFTTGPLLTSVSKLSGSSRAIPSNKDFHFFYNFDEFKVPVKEIAARSQSMLETIGSSSHVWSKPIVFPDDLDDAYDWLVNVNDEVFERLDASVDDFQRIRKKEEETGRVASSVADLDDGFQLVYGKKKKGASHLAAEKDEGQHCSPSSVKVASRDKRAMGSKPRVPFHIPTIPRPQDQFNILVNNSNQPFQHVWLQKSDDGARLIHPLENLSVLDFIDRNVADIEPVKPPPIELTPFKLVEEVKDLKELAAKLRSVVEFAVDLEHNKYRSFQGLTCLMQISTRTEDFVVDTLKLRVHIGPYLREVFKDPAKKKVMHGADQDILWLQRDFGIYVCNMFDTGQASRVLNLERNSLEYLLHHFCGVTANKEYQNADWRLRPLPDEMIKYAREDTHYLLHMYDLMRIKLLSTSVESENSDTLLVEVYKRSYDVCMKLYEKELLTDSSYLYIYGLQGAGFNAQQLAIVAALCEWRDVVARTEDESTGYILPNKSLLEIAKQMPDTVSKLRRLVKSKHPIVERNIGPVVSIIKHAIQNGDAFEPIVEHLKEVGRVEIMITDGSEALPVLDASITESDNGDNMVNGDGKLISCSSELGNGQSARNESLTISEKILPQEEKLITGVTVEVVKKPSRGFGALLGNSKRKFVSDTKDDEAIKLEQIKSSVNLPFHSFSGKDVLVEETKASEISCPSEPIATIPVASSSLEDIISLEQREEDVSDFENEEPASLSDLSSSFQKCFNQIKTETKSEECGGGALKLKPFDYEAAMEEVRFGGNEVDDGNGGYRGKSDSKGKKNGGGTRRSQRDGDESGDFPQGRRRQAFPATGNRSATFR